MLRDFAAIDFETANTSPTSVCSVGVVIVRGGEIQARYYSLIRPTPNYYSRFCTAVHGLRSCDTLSARPFSEVGQELQPLVEGLPLVAHNARFDERCLRAVCNHYGLPCDVAPFYDTLAASRRSFGRTLPNHQLHTVAAACGYDLKAHHHALADAEACAVIAMQLL